MLKRYKFEITLSCLTNLPQQGSVNIDVEQAIKSAFPMLSFLRIKEVKKEALHKYRDQYKVTVTSSRNPSELTPVIDNISKNFQDWKIKDLNGN